MADSPAVCAANQERSAPLPNTLRADGLDGAVAASSSGATVETTSPVDGTMLGGLPSHCGRRI